MGAGNNFELKAKSRYVMILNPDTVLKNTLEEIYKVSNNLDFAVLSPLSDNEDYPNYKIKKILKNEKNIFEVDKLMDMQWFWIKPNIMKFSLMKKFLCI